MKLFEDFLDTSDIVQRTDVKAVIDDDEVLMPDDGRFEWHASLVIPKFKLYRTEKSPKLEKMISSIREKIEHVLDTTRSVSDRSEVVAVCNRLGNPPMIKQHSFWNFDDALGFEIGFNIHFSSPKEAFKFVKNLMFAIMVSHKDMNSNYEEKIMFFRKTPYVNTIHLWNIKRIVDNETLAEHDVTIFVKVLENLLSEVGKSSRAYEYMRVLSHDAVEIKASEAATQAVTGYYGESRYLLAPSECPQFHNNAINFNRYYDSIKTGINGDINESHSIVLAPIDYSGSYKERFLAGVEMAGHSILAYDEIIEYLCNAEPDVFRSSSNGGMYRNIGVGRCVGLSDYGGFENVLFITIPLCPCWSKGPDELFFASLVIQIDTDNPMEEWFKRVNYYTKLLMDYEFPQEMAGSMTN